MSHIISREENMQNKLFGSREFYRRVLAIGVPIMIQNAITNFVSLLDNIMIGRVGTVEMSGVAIANQLIFVFNMLVFGAVAGAGIFGAQFFGNNDMDGVRHTLRFKLVICTLLTAVSIAVLILWGPQLINLYLKGEGSVEDAEASLHYGLEYMKVMYIGMLPYAITQAYAATLRETGETLLPMKAGVAAVLVNLTFNYILIFGHFGAPRMGVVGAAVATVLSRFVELVIVVTWAHRHTARFPYVEKLYQSLHIPGRLFRDILRRGTPLLLNEGLWAAGMAMLNQCYSLRSLDVVAATNISSTIWNLFACVYLAMGSVISIMVGQELGAGNFEQAKITARQTTSFSVVLSVGVGVLMAFTGTYFPFIYRTTDAVRHLATSLIGIGACLMPFTAMTNALYFTLRAGGKTIVTFLFDSAFVWGVNIPVAYVLSRYTTMPILLLYACCQSLEIIKCIIGAVMVKKGIWINNIVADKKGDS